MSLDTVDGSIVVSLVLSNADDLYFASQQKQNADVELKLCAKTILHAAYMPCCTVRKH